MMLVNGGQRYGAILADPPWRYETWSDRGRDRCPDALVAQKGLSERHYAVMALADIVAMPIGEAAADDCALFLWCTDSIMPAALEVGRAWGFEFKTKAFCWVKRTKYGKEHIGLGHWTRANPEDCWLFTRGSPKRLSRSVRKLIEAPVREHSRKPDEVYDRIEQLVDGPYLELFARTSRPGWDSWGHQAGRWHARRMIGDFERVRVPEGQLGLFG